eukprot:scpid97532/ scgid22112/ 
MTNTSMTIKRGTVYNSKHTAFHPHQSYIYDESGDHSGKDEDLKNRSIHSCSRPSPLTANEVPDSTPSDTGLGRCSQLTEERGFASSFGLSRKMWLLWQATTLVVVVEGPW